MGDTCARDCAPTDAAAGIDPRSELTALIHDHLSDQESQLFLDYLKEWLRTHTTAITSLLLWSLCVPL